MGSDTNRHAIQHWPGRWDFKETDICRAVDRLGGRCVDRPGKGKASLLGGYLHEPSRDTQVRLLIIHV